MSYFRRALGFIFLASILFSSHQFVNANAAQPGIFNAGGDAGFRPLFSEDSSFVKTIQMKSEQITIDLFPGYAVVYGQYEMYNHTDSTLTFNMGYPVNSIFGTGNEIGSDAHFIMVDSLHNFQSKNNTVKTKSDNNDGKWYYWQQSFTPKSSTSISVKFVVNTNNGHVRKGYTKRNYNAFLYLLESAATWKNPIEKGNIVVYLNGELTKKDIKGSQPSTLSYSKEQNALYYNFENKTPKPSDNLILTYGKKIEDFNFENILDDIGNKYAVIEQKAAATIANDVKEIIFDDPFDTKKKNKLKSLPLLAVLIGVWILVKLLRRKKG